MMLFTSLRATPTSPCYSTLGGAGRRVETRRCSYSSRHRWWDPSYTDALSDTAPVFYGGDDRPCSANLVPSLADAEETIEEADARFSAIGARIEYCRSLGVDYERAVKFISVVSTLQRTLEGRPASEEGPVHALLVDSRDRSSRVKVRIWIAGMSKAEYRSMIKAGLCPVCGKTKHRRKAMCPLVPNEVRPFLEDK